MMERLALALVHHPVLDRNGAVVAAAVTNLDLHDIARIGRTYGVGRYYVVTPVAEQQQLVARILQHWREGYGAGYNPDRGAALELVDIVPDLATAVAAWSKHCDSPALPLLTGARRSDGISLATARALLGHQPGVLVLGTGWGLAPAFFTHGWPVLEPISGGSDYNHLPVRAAAAILLDRLHRAAS
ncbi:RNA methyltransferase [Desulfuromonas carbonis]|uniref:RNA methyltransferase n=1 Tax=Desulfuromonas sp. DDH964 TaxID=1823759 RepID=UPI00078C18A2|nr:RNA methyltransferase [Desulfuromonas sp. DDH964]AMV73129.1 hypothetical protein DBW_2819 [Desulfuromonas sp. DDH964]